LVFRARILSCRALPVAFAADASSRKRQIAGDLGGCTDTRFARSIHSAAALAAIDRERRMHDASRVLGSFLWSTGVALALTAGTGACPGDRVEVLHLLPAQRQACTAQQGICRGCSAGYGGKLKITVLAAGELPYKAADVVKAVATNQVQVGDVAVGFAAGDVPELNVLGLPFLCTSYAQFDKAIPMVAPVANDVLKKKFNVDTVIHWTMPPQNLWANKPLKTIDDLKGMKVRAWNPEQVDMMKALGGSAMSITSAEVIPALERKVIDGAITSALSASDWRAYEIVKTGYMLNMTMGHQVMMVNGEALAKLPADVRQTFLAKAAEWAPKYRTMSETGDKDARANLVANKVSLVEPTAADLKKAQELMRPSWDQWAAKYGARASRCSTARRRPAERPSRHLDRMPAAKVAGIPPA
jgi:TRAP-type C4-dicarboxylate transport system substrate-binding protein